MIMSPLIVQNTHLLTEHLDKLSKTCIFGTCTVLKKLIIKLLIPIVHHKQQAWIDKNLRVGLFDLCIHKSCQLSFLQSKIFPFAARSHEMYKATFLNVSSWCSRAGYPWRPSSTQWCQPRCTHCIYLSLKVMYGLIRMKRPLLPFFSLGELNACNAVA